jgi:organic radical activating enzyme
MELPEVLEKIEAITGRGQFVSLTGGEPLLQAGFIRGLAPELKKRSFRVYLETNGTLPEELKTVINDIDVVAMDIKPPSACGKVFWTEQNIFLKNARDKAFVKMVVCDNTGQEEMEKAASMVGGVDSKMVLVLQPAEGSHAPEMQTVRRFQALASECLEHVSIIRQMHKLWGIP